MTKLSTAHPSLTRFAWLSVAAAVVTIGLKFSAYLLTGSVGLFSDAIESIVNLVGAVMALVMLTIAARPADEEHAYGHNKAEYFSSGLEGALIFVASISIAYSAIQRMIEPKPLEQLGIGLAVSMIATAVNLAVSLVLRRAGSRYDSITLRADSQHLMTDVWTSVGVLVGIGAVAISGWVTLDSIVALLVAVNILWTGYKIMRTSVAGLMDAAIPDEELQKVQQILDTNFTKGIAYHALRTRQSGSQRFVSLHVLVPGEWTVQQGHQLLEHIEADLQAAIPNISVFTHLESLDDPSSWDDATLQRTRPPSAEPTEDHPLEHLRDGNKPSENPPA